MNKIILAVSLIFLNVGMLFSQNESNSPYSLFGLGSLYESNYGGIPSLGGSGVALPTKRFINNLNPASLAFIDKNSFLFDLGGKASSTSYKNQDTNEKKDNFYFSHIAFASPITSKSGFSFALKPFTNSTYEITNLEIPIQGSTESYLASIVGTGGLNAFDFSYGYLLSDKLSVGFTGSVLFGSIDEKRTMTIAESITTIEEENDYNGFRPTFGTQYSIDSTFTIGATVKLPTTLKGSRVRSISTINNSGTIVVEDGEASDVDNFHLPTEIAFGVSKTFKDLNVTFDYERKFWGSTNQSDEFGDFSDQDKFSLGASYMKKGRKMSYLDMIQYSGGISYDTGYLVIDDEKVKNAAVHVGLGFPLENFHSFLNVTYSYGQRGKVNETLIKENYHLLTLNLSLEGIWFVKRKYD